MPGKDYSNPRILDFHTLNKPHEDMYDRGKIPRMPWYVFSQKTRIHLIIFSLPRHDVGLQFVGQPARDLVCILACPQGNLLKICSQSRHFVERCVKQMTDKYTT
jgi:phospholipase D1/2